MELNQRTEEEKIIRSKKMMLWFGIISLSMMFAGLTSAYIVSKERKDWLTDFDLPQAFYYSTAIILLSSVTMHFAKVFIKKRNQSLGSILVLATLVLGCIFVWLQFVGFGEIIDQGFYPTGSQSTVTTSFVYVFVFSHIVHILAGLIVLMVVLAKQLMGKYKSGQTLGAEMGTTFWHFVDFLWIYLFVFLMYFR
ncbi:MAG: cytochrome oxidase subunit III [Cytophagaceae bacterium]|nr:cytochrome oxidase subunit III [Cytophagaceae bacterium]|tara:strand:+ start:5565 stop:6146 length:582 start_codon:yes stop_codon:yes gene_type:complete